MHGWRARIGAIVTADDATVEPEFSDAAPSGTRVYASRMPSTPGVSTVSELEEQLYGEAEIERCADLLAAVDVDVICYNCTSGSLIRGPGYETHIEDLIADTAGVPGVSTSAAVTRALDALDVSSVAVTTPYLAETNEREREYLEAKGFDVTAIDSFRLPDPPALYTAATPMRAYREACAIDDPDADAIFISCTGYRTFEVIDELEADLDKPVVTSNQATLRDALDRCGVGRSDVELGRLFEV